MKFTSVAEKAQAYLSNTFVKVNGDILYVNGDLNLFNGKGENVYSLTNRNIKKFNFESPKLGYAKIGTKGEYVYLRRKPCRTWKTGVCERNVTPQRIFGHNSTTIIKTLEAIEMDVYPSFDEASKGKYPKAFSRCYALHNNQLYYCGRPIGQFIDNIITFETSNQHSFHQMNINSLCPQMEFKFKEYRYIDPDKEDC